MASRLRRTTYRRAKTNTVASTAASRHAQRDRCLPSDSPIDSSVNSSSGTGPHLDPLHLKDFVGEAFPIWPALLPVLHTLQQRDAFMVPLVVVAGIPHDLRCHWISIAPAILLNGPRSVA